MRLSTLTTVAVAISGLLLLNACNAQEDKKSTANQTVLATVNGTPIYQSSVDHFLAQQAMQGAPDTPEVRKAVLEELISRELVRQQALKQGLDKRPEVKQQMELAQQAILLNAYTQDFVKTHPVSDDQLKAEYDKLRAQLGDKQYRARHILVKTDKEAKDIIAQLKKGGNFEKLASEKSIDPGSRVNGGDLGFQPATRFVPEFSQAMTALKPGAYTQTPVQTQFGFHVIKLEEVRDTPKFEDVKTQLAPRVQQEQLRKEIAELRGKAKVEYKTAAPAETK